jgi:hypothetical protein
MARAITSEHTNAQVYETSVISTILFGKKIWRILQISFDFFTLHLTPHFIQRNYAKYDIFCVVCYINKSSLRIT